MVSKMRMWMIHPGVMCDKHLRGEHVECHMLQGSLVRGRSIKGFIEKNLLEPQSLQGRHRTLADEMLRRGGNHNEGKPVGHFSGPIGSVSVFESLVELLNRCPECSKRLNIICRSWSPFVHWGSSS